MNLEDQIRASAGGQGRRYRAGDDLVVRVEHRRRQRAARKVTATSVAAVVLFGGGALALSSLRDRGEETTIADSTVVSTESLATAAPVETIDTVPVPTTLAPASTAVPTTVPRTSPVPTGAPQLNIPPGTLHVVVTTPSDANVPMPSANPDGSTGLSEFWNVPSYGSEPVRGSGCGSDGQLGDMIPDGLWAGFVVDDGSDGIVGIDLLCIYSGAAGQSVLASGSGTLLTTTPDYLIVNNSTRARSMPMDSGVVLRLGARDAGGRCLDAASTTQWADIPADRQVWVRIHDGRITWILADCPPL